MPAVSETNRTAETGSTSPYAARTVALDYSGENGVGSITTRVYHGVSIIAGSNALPKQDIVGRIQSWQPDAYTRDGVHIYELSDAGWGRPQDYVPGRSTGFTIAITRAEVWNSEMEIAFGLPNVLRDLSDQDRPFGVREFWFRGTDHYETWEYNGCWFQGKNYDALSSDGDGVTKVTGTIAYVSRSRQKVTAKNPSP